LECGQIRRPGVRIRLTNTAVFATTYYPLTIL
jgi:hypothetical protein